MFCRSTCKTSFSLVHIANHCRKISGFFRRFLHQCFHRKKLLAAVPLASELKAPILLTTTSTVPEVTLNEIKRLGAKNVIIVGGEGVVDAQAQAALKKRGVSIERLCGDTRYETTVEIAKKLEKLNGKKPEEVFLVYANNFADALSVNSAAAIKNAPIIYLSTKGTINKTSKAYLESELQTQVGNYHKALAEVISFARSVNRLCLPVLCCIDKYHLKDVELVGEAKIPVAVISLRESIQLYPTPSLNCSF